jgi:hypothetical protein
MFCETLVTIHRTGKNAEFLMLKLVVYIVTTALKVLVTTRIKRLVTNTSRSKYFCSVVCFLLSNSPASEFYMPTFRNTSIFIGG